MATGSGIITGFASGLLPIPIPDDKVYVDYIFFNQTRFGFHFKTKIFSFEPKDISDCPVSDMVMFNSLTEKKEPRPEMFLIPVTLFRDPFRRGNHKLVLCEFEEKLGKPAVINMRRPYMELMDSVANMKPWIGLEQEYFLEDNRGNLVGWLANKQYLKLRDFYGAVGLTPTAAIEREIAEVHSHACLFAGVKFAGINREDCPGQWEYQIGPCDGRDAADHFTMSRILLERVAEMYGYSVNFDPKPVDFCIPGSGVHINFSTQEMRDEAGIEKIYEAMDKLASVDQTKLLKCYDLKWGEDNKRRLTGEYFVPDGNNFRMGVADKFASIRIPPLVAENKCGYFEERRPASNCCIYTAITGFVKAAMFGENYDCPK